MTEPNKKTKTVFIRKDGEMHPNYLKSASVENKSTKVDELFKLSELLKSESISREEYDHLKAEVIGEENKIHKPPVKSSGSDNATEEKSFDLVKLIGVLGAILFFFGAFGPVITVPILGDVNLFKILKGFDILIFAIAILYLIGGIFKSALTLTLSSFLGYWLIWYGYSEIQFKVENYVLLTQHLSLSSRVVDEAFAVIQLGWGMGLLIISTTLALVSGLMSGTGRTFFFLAFWCFVGLVSIESTRYVQSQGLIKKFIDNIKRGEKQELNERIDKLFRN